MSLRQKEDDDAGAGTEAVSRPAREVCLETWAQPLLLAVGLWLRGVFVLVLPGRLLCTVW